MFSMFSAVSGHFTRSLVFGAFLPILLFVAAASPVVVFLAGGGLDLTPVELWSDKTTILSIIVVALTGLIYSLNTPLIRFYEGYPWGRTAFGRRRKRKYRERIEKMLALQSRLLAVRGGLPDGVEKRRLQRALNEVSRYTVSSFPGKDMALPTRLGNVIRSFEEYPRQQYGISAIPLWPRLVAKIDKEYAAVTDETKTSFDFFLNCSFLASVLAALAALAGVRAGVDAARAVAGAGWIWPSLGFVFLAYGCYVASLSAAAAWGVQVKGAFDLFRLALLKQLGYEYTFKTLEEERDVWRKVSRQIMFGDPVSGGHTLPYSPPPKPPLTLWQRISQLLWP
jgi:hypothetical protein